MCSDRARESLLLQAPSADLQDSYRSLIAEIGIDRALVTCGKENVGSVRVILGNGGVFESEEFNPEGGEVVQRYWIQVGS